MDIRDYTNQFTEKDNRIAALSYFGNFAVHFASLYLAIQSWGTWYLFVPFVVINAFASIRLYVLQHDCGHHSLFRTRRQNEWAGYGLSPFTITPFQAMKLNHNLHHANISNLDHRETGEIHTMTLREWEEAGFWTRLGYRIYRNPFFMLPMGAIFVYFIRYRWPKNARKSGVLGVLVHNLLVIGYFGGVYLAFGPTGLFSLLICGITAGIIGVFLVFLQHNFEDTYWDRRPDLDFRKAALQGSSALDFGHWFDIATANIAYHDIHHFNARIPSYNLRKCHHNMPEEFALRRIGFAEAVASLRLKLWDEEQERLVPFPPRRVTRDAGGAGRAEPA